MKTSEMGDGNEKEVLYEILYLLLPHFHFHRSAKDTCFSFRRSSPLPSKTVSQTNPDMFQFNDNSSSLQASPQSTCEQPTVEKAPGRRTVTLFLSAHACMNPRES